MSAMQHFNLARRFSRFCLSVVIAMMTVWLCVPRASGQSLRLTPMSELEFARQVRELQLSDLSLDAARGLLEWHREEIEDLRRVAQQAESWLSISGGELIDGRVPDNLARRNQPLGLRRTHERTRMGAEIASLHDEIDRTYFDRLVALAPGTDEETLEHLHMSWRRTRSLPWHSGDIDGDRVDALSDVVQRVLPDALSHPEMRPVILRWEREVNDMLSRLEATAESSRARLNEELRRIRSGESPLDPEAAAVDWSEPQRLSLRIARASERLIDNVAAIAPECAEPLREAWWRAKYPFLWSSSADEADSNSSPLEQQLRALRRRAAAELDRLHLLAFQERRLIESRLRIIEYWRDLSVVVNDDRVDAYNDAAAKFTHEIELIERRIREEQRRDR